VGDSAMKKEIIQIPSRMDQLPLSTMVYLPDSKAKAIIQLSHGMSEHKERYIPLMEYLCQQGYICIIHDHRGHGKSIWIADDLGYFYEKGAEAIVEDLHQVTLYIKKRYEGLPLFLFGHSMGSLIVRAYLKKYDEIEGLIISGSPSKNPASKIALGWVNALSKIKGDHIKGTFFHKMAFGGFNKNFNNPSSFNTWLCTDQNIVKAYDKDSLCGFVFTLNGFQGLFSLLNIVYSKKNWKVTKKDLPIWFISGEEDPCMINQSKFIEAVNIMKIIGYENVTYKLYPGMRHEILNEINKSLVFQDIHEKLETFIN
jgi:alpha-beta hydrolase superfamily lysophospholipase